MRSLKKSILALGAFFVLAIALAACGSSSSGKNVASVGGNAISLKAYKHWMYVAAEGNASQSPGSPVIVPTDPPKFTACIKQVRKQIPSLAKTPNKQIVSDCSQLFTSLNATVMDFLIKGYWYQAEAHRLGIKVTPAQVQTAFVKAKNQQFKTAAAFQAFLKETGQTLADIKFRVLVNQYFTKLEARHKVPITAATIAKYYTTHTSQFGSPETRNIRIVRTKTAAEAATAKAALGSNLSAANWSTVAKKYSIDTSSKNTGGLLTGVTNGQEEAALNKAAFAAPANQLEGVIHGTFGYYVFEVVKITKSTQQTLAQATPLIKELLTSQATTTEQTAVDKAAKAHWGAKTICTKVYSMADCHGYKAPKTSSSASPTTAGASTVATPTTAGTAPAPTSTAPAATTPSSSAPAATTPSSSAPAATTPASSGPATTTPSATKTTK